MNTDNTDNGYFESIISMRNKVVNRYWSMVKH